MVVASSSRRLFRAARYYYYPGWQEPGTGLECMINEAAWNSLPENLQVIVKTACQAAVIDTLSDFTYNNGIQFFRSGSGSLPGNRQSLD